MYDVTAAPPSEAGAVKLTVTCAVTAAANTPVGAPGAVAGVTGFDAADARPVPAAFVAVTVNVYARAVGEPETVIDGTAAPVAVCPSGAARRPCTS